MQTHVIGSTLSRRQRLCMSASIPNEYKMITRICYRRTAADVGLQLAVFGPAASLYAEYYQMSASPSEEYIN